MNAAFRTAPRELFAYLSATFEIGLCTIPFAAVALESLSVTWTADPFDRIIVAQAQANRDSPLISADAQIRRHYERAIW
jgi:PIN domain nuclease of toxin-antitoxin system